jgi:hypothetical protein
VELLLGSPCSMTSLLVQQLVQHRPRSCHLGEDVR